jgi:hypothetical protein
LTACWIVNLEIYGNVVQLLPSIAGPGTFTEGHVSGPIPMRKAGAETTRGWVLKLHASLNRIMIDGAGMCGGLSFSQMAATGNQCH